MSSQPIIFFVLALISVTNINGSELKLVQVLCRHGDRAPIADYREWYQTDPYINSEYEPVGLGGLTEEGLNRSFALGEFLRSRYSSSLEISSEYSSSRLRVRSSNVDRCRKSAKAMLAAFFPNKGKSIPIYNQQLHKDLLFLGIHLCPNFRKELAKTRVSSGHHRGDEYWFFLRQYLSQYLDVNATVFHAFVLYTTLVAQSSFGLPLPNWTRKIYPSDKFEKIAGYEYVLQSHNIKMKRLNGGVWLQEFIENMDNAMIGREKAKMLVYVGHDINIAGFLSVLKVFEPHVPNFSSCVGLEMHRNPTNDEYHVKLFHRNDEELEELKIPGCSTPCSIENLKTLTKHLIPGNINKECGLIT